MDSQVTCKSCGHVNSGNATFCQHCGASLHGVTGTSPQLIIPPTGAPLSYGAPRKKNWWPLIIGLAIGCLVIPVIAILVAISLPNYIKIKEKAKEAEEKQNLHAIQLAVERFSVDYDGAYPPFLIGGEAKCATVVTPDSEASPFASINDCPLGTVSDALLAQGYLEAYPVNPFIRNGISIHRVQENLVSKVTPDDPLRNGSATGARCGTRFGTGCTTMGSVLADPRFANLYLVDAHSDNTLGLATYANIEYPFWDMWDNGSDKPRPYLPGQFFYKSKGPTALPSEEHAEPLSPSQITGYMMGTYGGIRTEGQDVLGDEKQGYALSQGEDGNYPQLWLWTRSELGEGHLSGSPFGPAPAGSSDQFVNGNPNGVRDAIVLVLSSGT